MNSVQSPIGLKRTLYLIRSDYRALLVFYHKQHSLKQLLAFAIYPGLVAVTGYRLSHFAHTRRWKFLSRLIYWLAMILTGADINPASQIDEGFIILHSTATIVSGKIGRNATLTAKVGIGGDASGKDIGAGPGLPVIGDRVVFGACSMILGACHIGDDAMIGAMSYVKNHVPAGSTVFGIPARPIGKSKHRKISPIATPAQEVAQSV